VCLLLANSVQTMIENMEKGIPVGNICMDLKLCNTTLNNGPDLEPMKTYAVNLDLPPVERWTELCSLPHVASQLQNLVAMAKEALHPTLAQEVDTVGVSVWELMPQEYAQEIKGCAAAAQIQLGWAAIFNIAYELSDACKFFFFSFFFFSFIFFIHRRSRHVDCGRGAGGTDPSCSQFGFWNGRLFALHHAQHLRDCGLSKKRHHCGQRNGLFGFYRNSEWPESGKVFGKKGVSFAKFFKLFLIFFSYFR
jgi:hypothetical protein